MEGREEDEGGDPHGSVQVLLALLVRSQGARTPTSTISTNGSRSIRLNLTRGRGEGLGRRGRREERIASL